ncbi:hypothetical protein [Streptomyces malaysiensis]|nr:hypothetical protein [Streptomyces malaysiensis]
MKQQIARAAARLAKRNADGWLGDDTELVWRRSRAGRRDDLKE